MNDLSEIILEDGGEYLVKRKGQIKGLPTIATWYDGVGVWMTPNDLKLYRKNEFEVIDHRRIERED